MSQHTHNRQYRDYSRELSNTQVFIPALTALTISTILPELTTYEGALDAITLGTAAQSRIVLDITPISADAPTNVFAQREIKWLVHYHANTTGKKFTLEIPTADPTGRLVPGTDLMDLTETAAANWKSQFEVIAVSPDDDTDQCTVDYVELVGRNL